MKDIPLHSLTSGLWRELVKSEIEAIKKHYHSGNPYLSRSRIFWSICAYISKKEVRL